MGRVKWHPPAIRCCTGSRRRWPAPYAFVRGEPMFEELQSPSGLEDAPHLGECGGNVGDAAQRPG